MNTFENPPANIDNSAADEVEAEVELVEDDSQDIAEAEEKSEQIEKWETLLGPEKVTEIRETIKGLEEPMKKMIEPVLENIKNGDYQLLIGDDASGRIPALIMRKFINKAYEQAHQPPITTSFIAGFGGVTDADKVSSSYHPHHLKWLLLIKHLREKKKKSSSDISQALIITEYVNSGISFEPLIDGLKRSNITPTMLTVALQGYDMLDEYSKSREERMGKILKLDQFYAGDVVERPPALYSKKQMSGVTKDLLELHAEPIRKSKLRREDVPSDKEQEIMMATMSIARDEARHVTDNLIAELLTPKDSH